MVLPTVLRQAVDRALEGVPIPVLKRASEELSRRYRSEVRDGRFHIEDDLTARAYLAVRLPATYAATRSSFEAVVKVRPDFAPRSQLDVGAGPGSAVWAAADCWPSLEEALLLESSKPIRGWGEKLSLQLSVKTTWRTTDVSKPLLKTAPYDLVTIAYLLNELEPKVRKGLMSRLWSLTGDTLVIVEPGTPAGWTRVLEMRDELIRLGANLIAPCPHAARCPLASPDWCHFASRVPRSRMHRATKSADVSWEDEKFIYLAVSRHQDAGFGARVLAPPRARKGLVELKLCMETGEADQRILSKRDGPYYKRARRVAWGDTLDNDD